MVFRGCLINTSSRFNPGYPYMARRKRKHYCSCWHCEDGSTKKKTILDRIWKKEFDGLRHESSQDEMRDR